MKRSNTVVVLSFLTLLLGGCLSTPSEPTNFYSLRYLSTPKMTPKHSDEIIKVDFPHAASTLMGKRIMYAKNRYETAYYIKNQWAEPLPSMLQDWMIQSIEDTEKFKGVVRSTSRVKSSFLLESDIVTFEHRLDSKSVTVSLHVNLIDSQNNAVIKSKTFIYDEAVEKPDAPSAVKAFNRALESFKTELSEWI